MTSMVRVNRRSVITNTIKLVVGRTGVLALCPSRLRIARRRVGLTQRGLAEAARVSETSVREYERGRQKPDAPVLFRIARALQVGVLDLLEPGSPVTLATLRTCVGYTQSDLAARAGLSRSRYAAIERGDVQLQAEDAAAIAEALTRAGGDVVSVEDVERAFAAAGVQWPVPVRGVEIPGDLAARVHAEQRPGEPFAAALARILERGLGGDSERE